MAITGKFVADFENFKAGADDAVQRLKKMEDSAKGVENATKRIGDPGAGTSGFSKMSKELSEVDRILGLFGINVGKEVGALKELGTVAETASGQIGLLGKASLVAGSAFAGWQIGRSISEFFGLDQIIGDATSKLMGWGDVAAEVAGAQADVLAKASKTAGRAITDLNEAMRINAEAAKKAAEGWKAYGAAVEALNAIAINYQVTLDTINGSVVEGAKALLDLGMGQQAIADLYGITAQQMNAIVQAREHDLQVTRAQADAQQKVLDKLREIEGGVKSYETGILGLSLTEQKATQASLEGMARVAEARQKLIDQTKATVAAAGDVNRMREQGAAGMEDPALAAITRRDEAIKAAERLRPTGVDVGPLIVKAIRDMEEELYGLFKETKAQTSKMETTINVSGVLDPRTIRELADAVGQYWMEQSGRKFPNR